MGCAGKLLMQLTQLKPYCVPGAAGSGLRQTVSARSARCQADQTAAHLPWTGTIRPEVEGTGAHPPAAGGGYARGAHRPAPSDAPPGGPRVPASAPAPVPPGRRCRATAGSGCAAGAAPRCAPPAQPAGRSKEGSWRAGGRQRAGQPSWVPSGVCAAQHARRRSAVRWADGAGHVMIIIQGSLGKSSHRNQRLAPESEGHAATAARRAQRAPTHPFRRARNAPPRATVLPDATISMPLCIAAPAGPSPASGH